MYSEYFKLNKTPGGVFCGRIGRYLQSLWFYVENNKAIKLTL